MAYSAFEVFEIAEQVERNGAKFYRAAAELTGDSHVSETFLRLAEWEVRHEKVFSQMKRASESSNKEKATPGHGESAVAPKAMAALAVFSIKSGSGWQMHGNKTQTDALRMAVKNERDTVAFYNGLKSFVSAGTEQSSIDEIIREETRHIAILERLLDKTD